MITSLINNDVSEKAKAIVIPLLRHTLRFLVPSFFSKHEPSIVRPTDFLDGMRGFACVAVFVSHCVPSFFPNSRVGFWCRNGTKNDGYIIQLPIIRLIYSGTSMVLIFFVLSGFSITLKPLKFARQGASDLLYNNLVSATFRRTGRLYFPCMALMLLVLLQSFLGCFTYSDDMLEKFPFLNDQVPPGLRLETDRLWRLCQSFWMWGDPMNPRSRPLWMPYATQLWTIPVELRCSFITWTVVFGLSRTRPIIRMTIMASLCLYLYARFHPYPPLFIAGAVFAEIYLAREESPDTSVETTGHKVKSGVLFTCALFLLSYPRRGGETTPGYSLLYKLGSLFVEIEPKGTLPIYFFPHIGAMLLVYSVSQSKSLLQPIFTTPLAKYLGKISFALYCVHTPLLNWVGYRIIIFWWTSPLGNNVGWLVGFSMLFVIVIFAADIFNRTVDEPCVRLAKWLENKCLDTACT